MVLFSNRCHPQSVKHRNENPLPCHPFPPKLLPACEYTGLRSQLRPAPCRIPLPDTPSRIRTPSSKSHVIRLPENSTPHTNVAIPTVWFQRLKGLHGNYVRHLSATTPNAPQKLHVIPPRPHSVTAQKPRNINDPISKPETPSGELRAKLQHLRPLAGPVATPHGGHRAQAATHPDR